MRKRMSLLVIGLLLVVQILQGFGFATNASAQQTVTEATYASEATDGASAQPSADVIVDDESQTNEPQTEESQTEKPQAEEPQTEEPQDKETADETELSALAQEPRAPKAMTENLITSVNLTVFDAAGSTVTDAVYEQGSKVKLDFNWALADGHDYVQGDTFTFDLLPENKFVIFNDISGDLIMEDGESVGTFAVNRQTRQVVMTFNEFIAQYDAVQGKISLETQFDKQKITGSTQQQIKFPINGSEQVVDLVFKADIKPAMSKTGAPNGNLNAKSINWTLEVNRTGQTVQNAVVTDPLPKGLALQAGSVAVYPMTFNLDGTASAQGTALDANDYTIGQTANGEAFTLSFKNPISSAYQIKFATDLTADAAFVNDEARFENKATFGGDGIDGADASATVTVKSGQLLDKQTTGYNKQTQTIDWAIKYNYGEQNIASAVLTDSFDDSHRLKGDVKVYEVSLATGTPVKGALVDALDYEVTPTPAAGGKTGFTLTFDQAIDSAYLIEYQTETSGEVYTDGKVVNRVTTGGITKEATRNVLQAFGEKKLSGTNYTTQRATWTITLNENKAPMDKLTLTDTFTNGGLTLVPGTLSVKNSAGGTVAPADYTLAPYGTPGSYKNGFTLEFNGTVSDKYTVTYQTSFDTDDLTGTGKTMPNRAVIAWIDTITTTDRTLTVTDTLDPNGYTKNNGYKNGTYNAKTKEITWNVGLNYNRDKLATASIEDALEANQKLVDGSVALHEMTIASNGTPTIGSAVPQADYKAEYDSASRKLVVSFNEEIDSAYVLTFRTSLEGKLIDNTAKNTAIVKNGPTVSASLTGSVSIPNGGEYVSKKGAQSGEMIDWQIVINAGQSYVSEASITDTPSANQSLVPSTFKLYKAEAAANGTLTKSGDPLKEGEAYLLKIERDAQGKEFFTLTFNSDISSAYILQYQSLINANNGEKVGNTVAFQGKNVETVSKQTSEEVTVGVSSGSGSGSGVRGQLTVVKVDAQDAAKMLAGATFTLDRKLANGTVVRIGTQTTGADGKAVFEKLLSGSYILQETQAPEGYELNLGAAGQAVTIEASGTNVVTVKNSQKPTEPVTPPVTPPVDPPVTPPVTPPVDPPVTPPVDPPVTPPGPPVNPPVTPTPEPPVPQTPPPVIPTPETPAPVTPPPVIPATEEPTPRPPGLYFPEFPLPTPLIVVPEDGPPAGGLDVDPDPATPEPTPTPTPTPTVPAEPAAPTPTVPQPDDSIDIVDETPQGGLDVDPDPNPNANPVPGQPQPVPAPIESPDGPTPGGTVEVQGGVLPQTGEFDTVPTRALGFGLILLGLLGFLLVRKKGLENRD
ncbi:collagen binding domain-containing protein [Saccharibacillus brassicae]|uniref:LPXTG cell wall anchor domain-containing protein n=1 Tax=Saccharibacillus brassicae TaxID=2583377 RepID=A0A4Y6UZS4_SACBS|nr:collagen binding domain-containing protein [Saccharibacillus brassicae]QDH22038.1 LPXTG cell wall anchor domain-containing protein [Saccharibacillus brassicae]